MIRLQRQAFLVVAAICVATPTLFAQDKIPHIGYVYPTGGQRGTYLEVIVGGQYTKEVSDVLIFGGGVDVEIVKHYRPLTQGEYVGLSQKIRFTKERIEEETGKKLTQEEAIKAAGVTDEQLKEMEIYRQREADRRRQPNSQIVEELTLKITIAEDAAMGKREMRVITPAGMSNPIWFFVNQWEERRETEPNDEKPDPVVGSTLPVVVNGQIMPGDVDRFSFKGRKGTRLLINVACRDLMPYLADAVPGWFQGVLVLYDGKGKQLIYSGAYHYRQDPVIYYEIPEDGDYIFEIRDSIYRGREDFVYRITLGELPFVTGIFPLGARANTDVTVELQGWNLAETQLDVRASLDRNRPVRWYTIPQKDKNVDIRFPLRIDMITEVLDQEPNDSIATAQEVTMPCVVNGRIDKADDRDVFKFSGFGTLEAEVLGRREGSPIDSALLLTDEDGNEIGFNDDFRDDAYPLITHHADSRLNVGMRGKGPFYLHLTDSQRKGGDDFIYRLYIRRPLPDFDLRVVPSTIIARPGTNVPITAHAIRRGEYDGEIQLQLVDPPEGFALTGDKIPGSEDMLQLTLTVPKEVPPEPVILEMDGHSVGRRHRKFSRPAIPSESMMQAFLWLQIVPAEQWTIVVSGRPASNIPLEFPPTPIKLKLGESTMVDTRLTAKLPLPEEVLVELYEPPKGITVVNVSPKGSSKDSSEDSSKTSPKAPPKVPPKGPSKEPAVTVELTADAKLVRPGMKGNLIFEIFRQWTPAPTEKSPKPRERRMSYGFLPAVPFEVEEGSRRKEK